MQALRARACTAFSWNVFALRGETLFAWDVPSNGESSRIEAIAAPSLCWPRCAAGRPHRGGWAPLSSASTLGRFCRLRAGERSARPLRRRDVPLRLWDVACLTLWAVRMDGHLVARFGCWLNPRPRGEYGKAAGVPISRSPLGRRRHWLACCGHTPFAVVVTAMYRAAPPVPLFLVPVMV